MRCARAPRGCTNTDVLGRKESGAEGSAALARSPLTGGRVVAAALVLEPRGGVSEH
jgi:hypothetical protein